MRRKYSIGLGAVLLAASALADPCPVALVTMASRVAALRHVPAPFAPPCRLIPHSDLHRELDAKLRQDLPVPPQTYLEILHALGFIPESSPAVYDRLLDFYASQVLGFYDPGDDEMVIVEGTALGQDGAPLVWAHELEHAAQQRLSRLPSRLLAMSDNSDEQRAASAIAEGEAMLVMLDLNASGSDPMASALAQADVIAGKAPPVPGTEGIPEFFVRDLLFPYTEGLAVVARRYRSGGWKAVDSLLEDPPKTTAAILHPDAVPSGPPLTDASLPPVPDGWKGVITDTIGEWGLAFWLGRCLPGEEATNVAASWDADRVRVIRRDGAWAIAWKLRARDDEGAVRLTAAVRSCAPELVTGVVPRSPQVRLDGRTIDVLAGWPSGPTGR